MSTKEVQQRILLIEPPFYRLFKETYSLDRYPLSLGYLAGTIKKRTDWDVVAYNADFYPQSEVFKVSYLTGLGFNKYLNNLEDLSKPIWREVKSAISEHRPNVVGISAKSQNFKSASLVAKLAKEINRQIIVIVGGPHPSMVGVEVLNCPDIDIIVKGEGENTIVELLNAINAQKGLDGIKGISYKKEGKIVENAPREFIDDLDALCFPHESAPEVLKDYRQYTKGAFGYVFATRGCSYNCFFCGSYKIWSRRVRFRSPGNVIREIKALQDKGITSIHFDDDIFGINKKYLNVLCNSIMENCPVLKWSCELHVKLIDEYTIALMKKSGCISIQIGIESGNNEMLKKIRKNVTIGEAISACRIIKKHGIELQTFFMVGFPDETESTLNDTVAAMQKTKSDYLIYSIFTPYPGTEAFEFCKENKLIPNNYDHSLYNHQSPANYFCPNISPQRFRALVCKIERIVDKKNQRYLRKKNIFKFFSLNTFRKIFQLGLINSFKKGLKIFIGK